MPYCEGTRNGHKIEHETFARSSGGGEVEINDYILRACWSRKGRVGVGVVSDLALQADEGPVISKEPEGLRLVPTLQRRDKGGQFLGAIWHVLTTEATTTTTKVRLLARTAVGVDCRMVHTGGEWGERGQSAYIAHDAGRAAPGQSLRKVFQQRVSPMPLWGSVL